ncbi:MAG: hypothetical protein V6Z81_02480 [Parvularculales bacterium]
MEKDAVIYMVQSWVKPGEGEAYLRWLEDKHMKDVLNVKGMMWARKVMLEQKDEARGWDGVLLIYGAASRSALESYLNSPERDKFWDELKAFTDVHYSTRVYGQVDFVLNDIR